MQNILQSTQNPKIVFSTLSSSLILKACVINIVLLSYSKSLQHLFCLSSKKLRPYSENLALTQPVIQISVANLRFKCRVLRRPYLGVEATNFYAVDIFLIEKIIQKILNICNGVFVGKVIHGSSADSAG